MKKIMLVLLAIVILFSVAFAHFNSNPEFIIGSLAKKGIVLPGELHYRIYLFGFLPIGDAALANERREEYRGRSVFHLSAIAKSAKVFAKLFSASATLDSYVDTQALSPVLFKQKVSISGKPEAQKEVFYDQKNGIMTLAGVKRQILPNTQDPLSLIFNLKKMNLDKAQDLEMNINTNQKNYILKGTVTTQDIAIKKDIYKIILAKAEIKRRDKNPYHKSNIEIVFLKEKENIPILIKVFASGVLINVKLVEIK